MTVPPSPASPESLAVPILCAVTDRRRLPILAHVAAAADAGVDWVQIREPDLPAAELYEVVRHAVAEVSGSAARTRIIVNDRLDVALAAGAHGVHLRGTSFDASRARALVAARDFLIGRSVHSVEEAVAVEAAGGLDYLIFGTMFPTTSKPEGHPLAGPEALASRRRGVPAAGAGDWRHHPGERRSHRRDGRGGCRGDRPVPRQPINGRGRRGDSENFRHGTDAIAGVPVETRQFFVEKPVIRTAVVTLAFGRLPSYNRFGLDHEFRHSPS